MTMGRIARARRKPLDVSRGGVQLVMGFRQREKPRADLEAGALRGSEMNAEAQPAVLEEKLRDAPQRHEPFRIADRQHGQVTEARDEQRGLTGA